MKSHPSAEKASLKTARGSQSQRIKRASGYMTVYRPDLFILCSAGVRCSTRCSEIPARCSVPEQNRTLSTLLKRKVYDHPAIQAGLKSLHQDLSPACIFLFLLAFTDFHQGDEASQNPSCFSENTSPYQYCSLEAKRRGFTPVGSDQSYLAPSDVSKHSGSSSSLTIIAYFSAVQPKEAGLTAAA